jgi:hypothetical protein
MIKVLIAALVLAGMFLSGYLAALNISKANRYLEQFFYVFSGAMSYDGIDKICIVNRNHPDALSPKVLTDIVGYHEAATTFLKCGGTLETCCPFFSETDSILVIKRGKDLSCVATSAQLNSDATAAVCAAPEQLNTMLSSLRRVHRF